MTKSCSRCKKIKFKSEFTKYTESKDKLRYWCKECRKVERKIYRLNNKEKISIYSKKYNKEYKMKNKEKTKKYNENYRALNPEKIKQLSKNYWLNNKEKVNNKTNRYKKDRKERDINFKLAGDLRSRISIALTNNQKTGSAVRDLGCSISEFKLYIENQFKFGMTWKNHSKTGWHLDHVIPLSKFNLEDHTEFLEACNWLNIQPLWAKENLVKANKYDS